MILFLALAAAMLLLAMAILILPLLRGRSRSSGDESSEALTVLADQLRELRDEHAAGVLPTSEYELARQDLERQALQAEQQLRQQDRQNLHTNWGAALATAVVLPLLATLLYLAVGEPSAIGEPGTATTEAAADPHGAGSDSAVAALAQRLTQQRDDVEGWILLARSYYQAQRLDDALDAYRTASELQPENPDLLVEYANTLAAASNRNLSGQPRQLIERALELDPDHPNALAFAGLAALQQGEREQALRHWRHLQELVPGAEDQARVARMIAMAEGRPGAVDAIGTPAPATESPTAARSIRGTVTVAAALASEVAAADTLFVFARAPDGPPMPLAAMRTRAGGWPVRFTLDDSSAMTDGMVLSRFDSVDIVARVSRLGSANAQPGDIEGRLEGVAVGSNDVRVVLDRVLPR